MNAGQKLLAWRKRAGLTQFKAAKAAGISQPTWQGYEAGTKVPSVSTLQRLIDLTDGAVSLADYAESEESAAVKRAQRAARTVRATDSSATLPADEDVAEAG